VDTESINRNRNSQDQGQDYNNLPNSNINTSTNLMHKRNENHFNDNNYQIYNKQNQQEELLRNNTQYKNNNINYQFNQNEL